MHYKKGSGFTLIELMVVVVIIGVLAVLAIVMFRGASDKAKYAGAKIFLKRIYEALEEYHSVYGAYPADVYPNIPPPGLVPDFLDEWPSPERDAFNSQFDYENQTYHGVTCIGVTYLGKDKKHELQWNWGFEHGRVGQIMEIPTGDDLFIVVAKDALTYTKAEAEKVSP